MYGKKGIYCQFNHKVHKGHKEGTKKRYFNQKGERISKVDFYFNKEGCENNNEVNCLTTKRTKGTKKAPNLQRRTKKRYSNQKGARISKVNFYFNK